MMKSDFIVNRTGVSWAGESGAGGFTLVEVVVVIVLIAILATGALMFFINIGKSADIYKTIRAAELAQTKMEEIVAGKKSADGAFGFDNVTTEASFTVPTSFSGLTEVYCVDEGFLDTDNGDGSADCSGGADIEAKRVRVAVSWSVGNSVELVTVLSNH